MKEKTYLPVLSRKTFYRKLRRNFIYALVMLFISLSIGMGGYHSICNLSWIDSLLNACMILTGMGPVNAMTTSGAKLFASFYALFSGVAFLTTVGMVLAPIIHRMMHFFHMEEEE
ncbi:MAG TPA: hypothetical protein VFU15_12185 [Bacteroidia bacterium]|nr:hypothetical protein [Bacteroidia bacterium]